MGSLSKREAMEAAGIIAACQTVHQRFENFFSMSANNIIDIARAKALLEMLRWKVAAPHHYQVGVSLFQLPAKRHSMTQLRAGHDGDSHSLDSVFGNQLLQSRKRILKQVAINDAIVVFTLQKGSHSQEGHRKNGFSMRRAR